MITQTVIALTKSLSCVPCNVSLDFQNVNPMNRPETIFRAILDITNTGSRQ